jgi:hypothetical protein
MGANGMVDAGAVVLGRTTEDLGGIQIFETWHTDDAIHKNNLYSEKTAAEHHVTRSIKRRLFLYRGMSPSPPFLEHLP